MTGFDITRLPPLREVIAQHGLSARYSLGQHFLLDTNLIARIVREAGDLPGFTVLEVGPGPGGLTRALLASGAQVVAIEQDRRCIPALNALADIADGRLKIIEGDALSMQPSALCNGNSGIKIVSNLPYNVGTKLLLGWLRDLDKISSMTLMFQKEVAERLCAPHGSTAYGRLSIITQWLCQARILFDIPAAAFVPPPKVTSTVVQLTPLDVPEFEADLVALENVTRAAFGQRRKMLRSSLKTLGADMIGPLLEETGIDPTVRAETLSVEEFCQLACAWRRHHEGA